MDDTYLFETFLLAFKEIFLQESRDFLRGKGMKINPIFNGDAKSL
jgi:hypothetical protein